MLLIVFVERVLKQPCVLFISPFKTITTRKVGLRAISDTSMFTQQALVPEAGLHDAQDEELDTLGMPVGWRSCPALGRPIWRFIPSKVPLGPHFNSAIPESDRYTVQDAVKAVENILKGVEVDVLVGPPSQQHPQGQREKKPAVCRMVIDLTNSSRYYRRETFEDLGYVHVKIPNRGRGEVPAPQAVNDFVFEVQSYLNWCPEGYILVHCTHGFNRTGFMIVSHLMRMLSDPTTTVGKAVKGFADARPPGIYKPYYVKYLYHYYHEHRPKNLVVPNPPAWKAGDSPGKDKESEEENDEGLDGSLVCGAVGPELCHEDPIGEAVSKSEGDWVRSVLMEYMLGVPPSSNSLSESSRIFPGSQPVSLARSNLHLLCERRYWVTWKADGTRYLILIHRSGTYLIDRSNNVTRVQARWPSLANVSNVQLKAPVGPFHAGTILDGEMVVDEDLMTGNRTRRFLAYDLMALNGQNWMRFPWKARWQAIQQYVEAPRRKEADAIAKGTWALKYDYGAELFRFRRKDFWPLSTAEKLIRDFIPRQISHEADGLIFQPHDDPYKPLTCEELLKWKFAHLNSVDFRVSVKSNGEGAKPGSKEGKQGDEILLQLLHPPTGGGQGGATVRDLPGAKVTFPPGVEPVTYNNHIIECTWDKEAGAWSFLRERRDKKLPNAFGVYKKVVASIEDDIQEEELLKTISLAVKEPAYKDEVVGPRPSSK